MEVKRWYHVVFVRERETVRIHLNGNTTPEIRGTAAAGPSDGKFRVLVGGNHDGVFNFEGKIDEVAIYDRALSPEEIQKHYQRAKME